MRRPSQKHQGKDPSCETPLTKCFGGGGKSSNSGSGAATSVQSCRIVRVWRREMSCPAFQERIRSDAVRLPEGPAEVRKITESAGNRHVRDVLRAPFGQRGVARLKTLLP